MAWLLRRRLIIQLHTYILPLFSRAGSRKSPEALDLSDSTEAAFVRINVNCGGELLRSALPSESERLQVLAHYQDAVQRYPEMLHLFLRLLTRLPAHLEEIMFLESVNRQTLTNCLQLFSPFLMKMRLPDPVTACFAGVEWPY